MAVGHPTNGYTILGVLLRHAPNRSAQALMSRTYNEVCEQVAHDFKENIDLEIEKVMVGFLADGLKYNNWPWTVTHFHGEDGTLVPYIK
jgi:hypothetical protein